MAELSGIRDITPVAGGYRNFLRWQDSDNLWSNLPEEAAFDSLTISGTMIVPVTTETETGSVTTDTPFLYEIMLHGNFAYDGSNYTGRVDQARFDVDSLPVAIVEYAETLDLTEFFGETDANALIRGHLLAPVDEWHLGGDGPHTLRTGNNDNQVFGSAGDDNIAGGDADDIVYGGRGDDQLFGGSGINTLIGGTGDDTLSSVGSNGGYDLLKGGAGDDSFIDLQTAGLVEMVGGDGADSFEFTGPVYLPGQLGAVIKDFAPWQGDVISLGGIHTSIGGIFTEVHYLGDAAFSGVAVEGRLELRMEDGLLTASRGTTTPMPDAMLYLRGFDTIAADDTSWLELPNGAVFVTDLPEPEAETTPARLIMTRKFDVWEDFRSTRFDDFSERGPWHVLDNLDGSTGKIRLALGDLLEDYPMKAKKNALVLIGDFVEDEDGAWSGDLQQIRFADRDGTYTKLNNLPDDLDLADLIASEDPYAIFQQITQNGLVTKFAEDQANFRAGPEADKLIGNALDNVINGARGDDLIKGKAGDDQLSGYGKLIGGAGDDILSDGRIMKGGSGDDTLQVTSSTGQNIMTGGEGADSFNFSASPTWLDGQLGATVTDFSREVGDQLLFSYLTYSATGTIRYIGDAEFSASGYGAPELRMENGLVTFDANGDGVPEHGVMVMLEGHDSFAVGDPDWIATLPGSGDYAII